MTHSPDQVRTVCDRAVVLSHGVLVGEGEPGEVVRIFREGLMEEAPGMAPPRAGGSDIRTAPDGVHRHAGQRSDRCV